jgi:hypothetical protein
MIDQGNFHCQVTAIYIIPGMEQKRDGYEFSI